MRAVVAAAGLLAATACSPAPEGPNVLLITIDTLRTDRLTSYGGPPGNSPRLDALAAEGVRFASVQAPRGLTWPSLTTIMTGLQPRSHHVRFNGGMLDASHVTLPEILAAAGYDTGGFIANMCDAPNRGLHTFYCAWWADSGPPVAPMRKSWASHEQPDWDAAITERAANFIRAARRRPFFAWLHYIDPHKPYDPVAGKLRNTYDGTFPVDDDTLDALTLGRRSLTPAQREQLLVVYDSQITGVDAHIGTLLAVLEEEGLADNTLVVVTADHGEELGDHNHYFYHLSSVYEQVLALPWIARFPGHLPAGRVVAEPVAAVDIAPTILELLGQPAPAPMEGTSRLSLARGEAGAGGAAATFAEWSDRMLVVGQGNWRYVWNPMEIITYGAPFQQENGIGFRIGAEELYDLATDPLQQENSIGAHPEQAAAMRRLACAFVTERDFSRAARRTVDAEVEARLRSLGYLPSEETGESGGGPGLASFCQGGP
jgi:arylsulfatase A-like enzyme